MSIETKAQYLFYLCLFAVVVLNFISALWACGDARKRGKSPLLVGLLVFILQFPLGLIAWLIFRPAPPEARALVGGDIDADLKRRANAGHL